MSIAWCLGNQKTKIEEKLYELFKILELFQEGPDFSYFATHYILKTGYKEFRIELK